MMARVNSLFPRLTAITVAFASAAVLGFHADPAYANSATVLPDRNCFATSGLTVPPNHQINITAAPGDTIDVVVSAGAGPTPQAQLIGTVFSFEFRFGETRRQSINQGDLGYTFRSNGATLTLTCNPVGGRTTGTPDGEVVSAISANSQTEATGNGVGTNARNRLGDGGGNVATQNTVFLSTQNLPGAQRQFGQPDWNAWVALEGRSYVGAYDGWTGDVVIGLDMRVRNDLLIGGLLAFGRTDLTSGATRSEVNSLAIGAYFAKRFQSDLFLDGFVSFARPDYQTQGTSFTAQRVAASLNLSGSYTGGRWNVTPFGKLSGYREEQPAFTGTAGAVAANTITSVNLNAGAKVEPLAPLANGILPYISLSVDMMSNSSTLTGTQTHVSPRIGVGFGMDLGGGYLSVDLDAGNVRDDVRDMGLRATYEFSF